MPTCSRCNRNLGLLDKLGYNKQAQRCAKCDNEVRWALNQYRKQFLDACQDGIVTDAEWQKLTTTLTTANVNQAEALEYIRGDALNLLERTLTFAFADGMINQQEETDLARLRAMLQIPDTIAAPLLQRLDYLKTITAIRQGALPRVTPTVQIESDETCHMETAATYHKVNAKSTTTIAGRLVATNRKLTFLSGAGGVEIPWKSIMRIERLPSGVYLELSKKSGNGLYTVDDALVVEAVLDTLTRMAKRQLLAVFDEDQASRHIPHNVRLTVWQRDQGKCVQCSAASYLEFDHIIPFSKGGASTAQNVQLLCRRCNLAKGDRL